MTYNESKGKLSKQFIVPPFSILDTRLKYWNKGKEKWDKYNIESELGRTTSGNNTFEDLVINPRNAESNKIITKKGGRRSIFDPFLTEIMYRWFCPNEGRILDPFAGGSVRGIVASTLNYEYVGIELRPEQIKANRIQLDRLRADGKLDNHYPELYTGSSLTIPIYDEYDMIFSCPPYYDLEKYSDLRGDLSNAKTYDVFLNKYTKIIKRCVDKLKDDRFAVFVVSDLRDKEGYYRNFVGDTKSTFINTGMKLYNDIVLITQIGSLPLRCGIPFAKNRKVGRAHQNVLVFYKGDVNKIRDNFKEII